MLLGGLLIITIIIVVSIGIYFHESAVKNNHLTDQAWGLTQTKNQANQSASDYSKAIGDNENGKPQAAPNPFPQQAPNKN